MTVLYAINTGSGAFRRMVRDSPFSIASRMRDVVHSGSGSNTNRASATGSSTRIQPWLKSLRFRLNNWTAGVWCK